MAKKANSDLNKFNLTKDIMADVLRSVSFKMHKFKKELISEYDLSFSNKNLSEIMGKVMEKVCADTFTKWLGYDVKRALTDKDPDLMFTNINTSMEIKVTSTNNSWTGGEFSKRPVDYLLISWGGDFDEFFCCLVHLEKRDWDSNFQKSYYGPTLKAKTVYEKKDKIVFFGDFELTPRNNVKIERRKIL